MAPIFLRPQVTAGLGKVGPERRDGARRNEVALPIAGCTRGRRSCTAGSRRLQMILQAATRFRLRRRRGRLARRLADAGGVLRVELPLQRRVVAALVVEHARHARLARRRAHRAPRPHAGRVVRPVEGLRLPVDAVHPHALAGRQRRLVDVVEGAALRLGELLTGGAHVVGRAHADALRHQRRRRRGRRRGRRRRRAGGRRGRGGRRRGRGRGRAGRRRAARRRAARRAGRGGASTARRVGRE